MQEDVRGGERLARSEGLESVIYLDHQATTPLDPRVLQTMAPWIGERFGNPMGRVHPLGWDARKTLETARAQVAELIGARLEDVIFTSGGMEADCLALRGVAEALYAKGKHIVISGVERSSIRETAKLLQTRKWEITEVPVDTDGLVDPEAVRQALRPDTVLVAVQLANGEVGTIQPVESIGKICASRDVLFHVDATAAAAWLPIDVKAMNIHLLSLSGHHMFGPMGIGVLYARRSDPAVPITPLLTGGGTERGLRAGTPNLPGAVGLGRAAEICRQDMEKDVAHVRGLRDRLERGILARSPAVEVLGNVEKRLPHVSALKVPDVQGEALVLEAPEVAFAAGAASASDQSERSYVLTAMGLSDVEADSVVRFGLGRATTEAEIDAASGRILSAISKLRIQARGASRGGLEPGRGLRDPGGGSART